MVNATLNPKLIDNVKIHDSVIVETTFNKVIQKLVSNHEDYIQEHMEFKTFHNRVPPFVEFKNTKEYPFLSHHWWDQFGLVAIVLGLLTQQISGQVLCASSCEQNWNLYQFVDSKVWNILASIRVEDLVYIYTNVRLINTNLKEKKKNKMLTLPNKMNFFCPTWEWRNF